MFNFGGGGLWMTLNKIYFTVIRPIFALICSIMEFLQ